MLAAHSVEGLLLVIYRGFLRICKSPHLVSSISFGGIMVPNIE